MKSSLSSVLAGLLLLIAWSSQLRVATGIKFYSATCNAEFLITNDTSYNGYDIKSSHDIPGTLQYSSTQDPATCCSLCYANATCTAWTVSNEAGYGCYLKHATYAQMKSTETAAKTNVAGYRRTALSETPASPAAAPGLLDSPTSPDSPASPESPASPDLPASPDDPATPAGSPDSSAAGCCADYPTNAEGIQSIVVLANTDSTTCDSIAQGSFTLTTTNDVCLIPFKYTCEQITAEGGTSTGSSSFSLPQCSESTTTEVDQLISEAAAGAPSSGDSGDYGN